MGMGMLPRSYKRRIFPLDVTFFGVRFGGKYTVVGMRLPLSSGISVVVDTCPIGPPGGVRLIVAYGRTPIGTGAGVGVGVGVGVGAGVGAGVGELGCKIWPKVVDFDLAVPVAVPNDCGPGVGV